VKYRKFGKTGWDVAEVSFGAWAIGGSWGKQNDDDSLEALHEAISLGVNFIDTAAGYGNGKSERIIGKLLKENKDKRIYVATKTPPSEGPWPPSPYCLASDRYSESYLRKNVEERLENLQTDSLDVLLLHTWTRAWNRNPEPLYILNKLKEEGLIKYIGISCPEHDQNSVIRPMEEGLIDAIEVIYNILEQEPAAEILPVAKEKGVGVIVRVPFDEGSLTGKFTESTTFGEGDFRSNYFSGDRLSRTVKRVDAVKEEIEGSDLTMPELAIKFCLQHDAVSTVIPGMRNKWQAEKNLAVSEMEALDIEMIGRLKEHNWRKAFWYRG
jgi:aryl-alcohol dehydrogenase-like predicted oxidoreductase